jgi:hypothetical protein
LVNNSIECPAHKQVVLPYCGINGALINIACQVCCLSQKSSDIGKLWKSFIPALQDGAGWRLACDLGEEMVGRREEWRAIKYKGA